ncbi:MAG: pyruvate dehydrogenase complex dihydrolipoamide acetyltransferase [Rickettsiales bacterium]|nr:MAG: pyruvate dehydrogenase complex dihydrolipoamide acetyltransferase [Rickettsiales bacterium]
MPIKILMPALSPTMEHGNLTKWFKKAGDKVKAGEVIAEIETDKATMEVEAVDEGVIARILIQEGTEEVPVNTLIAVLLEEGEDDAAINDFITKHQAPSQLKQEIASAEKDNIIKEQQVIVKTEQNNIANKTRIFASPLAKRVAAMEGINLAHIIGSGPHGRIIKADVLSGNSSKGKIIRHPEEFYTIPNNNMRKVIAKRLLESKLTVPHFYLSIECVMDELLAARMKINDTFSDLKNDKNKKLSVNDFIILAAAKALKEVPQANASWTDSAIKIYNNVDISVAVAIDGGLITPVINNADQKDIFKISDEMKDLAKRARENSLKPEEYQGGGFSISNLGMYGIKSFNAIINPPQGCIIAIGMSNKRAVCIDDKIEIRTMMDVNLSCDHRVVDGAVGAQFLASFKKYIESPILMFI